MKVYYGEMDEGYSFDALVTDADYELARQYNSSEDIPDDVYEEYNARHEEEIMQLTEYVIPDTYKGKPVLFISENAFTGGKSTLLYPEYVALKRVKVGKYVEVIEDVAFGHLPALEEVDLPESLESMYGCVFIGSGEIKELYFGKKFDHFSWTTFRDSKVLSFDVDPGNSKYRSESGCLIENPGKILRGCPGAVLPSGGIESIADFAFESIPVNDPVIPEGVDKIGKCAFYKQSFKQVTLPSTLRSIGEEAFSKNPSLEKIVYNGTMAQWSKVGKSGAWGSEPSDFIVVCTDGAVDRTGVERKQASKKQGFLSKLKSLFRS